MDKEKKRGRPSIVKSPRDEKKKKLNSEKVSLDKIITKVSNNLVSSFDVHNDWLQEVLPASLEELYRLRVELEPDTRVMPLCEINDMINSNIAHLNGNDELFKKIHELFENFVNDDMEEIVLVLLENFNDKVKILIEEKKERVNAIIRKSIGIKMFPELKTSNMTNYDNED